MDVEENITCDVCAEIYDEIVHCPRMLACGHSFCSFCLYKVLAEIPNCPLCASPIKTSDLIAIPINYALKKLAEKYADHQVNEFSFKETTMEKGTIESALPSVGFCEDHQNPKQLRCMTCHTWICGVCAAIEHKQCNKPLFVKEAIERVNRDIKHHLQIALFSAGDASLFLISKRKKVQEENDQLIYHERNVSELRERINKTNQDIECVENLSRILKTFDECLKIKMSATNDPSCAYCLDEIERELLNPFKTIREAVQSMEDYKTIFMKEQLVFGKPIILPDGSSIENVFNCLKENEKTRWGQLDVKDEKLIIQCLSKTPPKTSICLTIDQCLDVAVALQSPIKVFLRLASNGVVMGDVIVRLTWATKEATKAILENFLELEKNSTLKGKKMCADTLLTGVINPLFFFPLPAGADQDRLLNEQTKKKWKQGEIGVQIFNSSDIFQYKLIICVQDGNEEWECIPLGEVESGLEIFKNAFQRLNKCENVKIMDCGWILKHQ